MKTKLFSFLLALAASVGTIFATRVQIGDLYYNVDEKAKTAEVVGISQGFSGEVVIPSSIDVTGIPPLVPAPAAGYVTFVIQIPEDTECNGIAIKGSVDGTTWTGANEYLGENGPASADAYIKFEAIDGSKKWFKATYKLGAEAWGYEAIRMAGKICLIYTDDGSWQGQAVNWEYNEEYTTTDVSTSGDGLIQVHGSGLVYVNVGGWQHSECVPQVDYNITVIVPEFCDGEFDIEVIGGFCGWSDDKAVPLVKVEGQKYQATIKANEYDEWKVRGVGGWDKEIQLYHAAEDVWSVVSNNVLGSDVNVTMDYGSFSYRWNICSGEEGGDEVSLRKANAANKPRLPKAQQYTFTVTSIGESAFQDCTALTSVTIPNSVKSIGSSAFNGCIGLTSVIIPNTVTIIENATFYGCSSLVSVPIPNSVTTIRRWVFCGCSSLTSVAIPRSVTNIGSGAFENCTALTSVYNYAETPQVINTSVFAEVNINTCTLYVPEESMALYQSADVWKDFGSITAISEAEEHSINYLNKSGSLIDSETVALSLPAAPEIDGFMFIKWVVVASDLSDGINIQAIYEANNPASAPAVVVNPANKAQKLIREGNVYILTDTKTYNVHGQTIK